MVKGYFILIIGILFYISGFILFGLFLIIIAIIIISNKKTGDQIKNTSQKIKKIDKDDINIIRLKTIEEKNNSINKLTQNQKTLSEDNPKSLTNKNPAESHDDVQLFWESIKQQKILPLKDVECGALISKENYSLFQRFIYNTKKELIITTNVFSNKTLIELLSPIRNKDIEITIITAREKDKRYDAKNFLSRYPLKLNIILCSKNHSKIMIRDNSKILIGSSNLDDFSLHQALETNMVSQREEDIQEVYYILKSILKNKDLRLKNEFSNIVYSGSEDSNLPLKIKELLKEEEEGLTILMSLQLFNVKILEKIEEWNINNIKINIELSNHLSKGEENAISKDTYFFLKKQKYSENINLKFNKETIHSKVYQFHSQKKTLISSLNMTPNSWSTLFEAGIISDDLKDYLKIQRKINSLNHCMLILKDIAFETSMNPIVWKQRPITENRTNIPWDLPEAKKEFQFSKENQKIYFKKLVKDTLRDSSNEKVNNNIIYTKTNYKRLPVDEKWFIQTHPELFIEKNPQLFDSITKYNYQLNKKNYETKTLNNTIEIRDNKSTKPYLILLDSFNKSNEEITNLLKRYDKLLFISDKRKSKKKIIQKSNRKIIQLTKSQFEKRLIELKPQDKKENE